jgi:putative DNA primase/helicase
VQVDELLERFEGVKGGNGQWTARCPAHDDRNASLTVAVGRDGQLLVTCWAGCNLEAIARAVGVDVRDLFPNDRDRLNGSNGAPQSLAALALPTQRELERYVVRFQGSPETLRKLWDAKGWRQSTCAVLELGLLADRVTIPVRRLDGTLHNLLRYSPNGKTPKILAEQGVSRTPFYAFADDDGPVFIVEGEADGISMVNVGLNVIAAPGASAKAHEEWLEPVRGRVVYVCMDADDPGRKAATRWARAAFNAGAAEVRVLELEGPKGYDVGELVRDMREHPDETRRLLLELAAAAPVFTVAAPEQPVETSVVEPAPAGDDDGPVDELAPGSIIMRPASDVRARRVEWLWRGRIARARVGVLFGPPGMGKSTLLALLIADLTRAGERVMIASAEDDPETTIVPRLLGAGAVLSRVTIISTKAKQGETNLLLPRDLDMLGASLETHALLLIDPLNAHLSDEVNGNSDQSVRSLVLAPLAWYARKCDCAVAVVMHPNKSQGGDALSRISGSGGYGGAARFVLLLGAHPDDVGKATPRQVLVHVKASEGELKPALTFRRQLTSLELEGETFETPVLELVADDERISAESVLAVTDPDEAGAFVDAVEWLQRELIDGPKPSKRLLAVARERGDFSERTLRKAKRTLGVRSEREPGGTGWLWVPKTI